MKTLVTGGTGFIGSRLIERLSDRGDTVLCVAKDRLNAEVLRSLGVETVLGNLANGIDWKTVLDGVDVIFHVAGVTRGRSAADYITGNAVATERFLEAVMQHRPGLRRFLYVSSLSAVGPSPDGRPITEESPYHPVSDYGRSKFLAEQAVLRRADSIPITIVRPSAVYGPRERDMYDYIRTIMHGLQLLIGYGRKWVNLVYVDDLVDGIIRAADSPRAVGQTYFLGSERAYDEEEVGETIASIVRRHPLRVHVPHAAAYAVGAIGELSGRVFGKDIFMNIQKVREVVQKAWSCSVDKARRELGFHQQVSLAEGMGITYRWYLDNGWL